jgi:hypothetical protein
MFHYYWCYIICCWPIKNTVSPIILSLVLIIPEPKSIFKVPLPLLTSSPPLILPEDKVVLIKSCILLYVTTPKDFTGILGLPVKLNVPPVVLANIAVPFEYVPPVTLTSVGKFK